MTISVCVLCFSAELVYNDVVD